MTSRPAGTVTGTDPPPSGLARGLPAGMAGFSLLVCVVRLAAKSTPGGSGVGELPPLPGAMQCSHERGPRVTAGALVGRGASSSGRERGSSAANEMPFGRGVE